MKRAKKIRCSGVSFGEVTTILVIAGFLFTLPSTFANTFDEKLMNPLMKYLDALFQTFDETRNRSINQDFLIPCLQKSCVPFCCPMLTPIISGDQCVADNKSRTLEFLPQHDPASQQAYPGTVHDGHFEVFTRNPCQGSKKYYIQLNRSVIEDAERISNGSVETTFLDILMSYESFCIASMISHVNNYVLVCYGNMEHHDQAPARAPVNFRTPVCMIFSVLFFLFTFIVYSIIPELRKMHGHTLRGYIGSTIVADSTLAYIRLTQRESISNGVCIFSAFVMYFFFLSSFFWLTVIGFDIWSTFREFTWIQGSVKQQEKKKSIMYSIYAWGSASLLTGICVIMDFVPSIPRSFIRPEFGTAICSFNSARGQVLYFYGPIGITMLCNIFLYLSTTTKIRQHKKDMVHHLKGMNSQRYDDNKQRSNLYLKLVIVMGLNWSTGMISWLKDSPHIIWKLTDIVYALRGVIIFIIFVCNDKTRKLLLKRLDCQNNILFNQEIEDKRLSPSSLEDRYSDSGSGAAPGEYQSLHRT